jgi:antitoxin component YwqK of YwqJK toxin-antitoxin module
LRDGKEVRFSRQGVKIAELTWAQGRPVGIARTWYDDGSKKSEYNKDPGLAEGTEIQFHRNGEARMQVPLVRGVRHDKATTWNEVGVKWAEVQFVAGRQSGRESRFDAEGNKIRAIEWENDRIVRDEPTRPDRRRLPRGEREAQR